MTRSIPEPLKRTITKRPNGRIRVSDNTGTKSRVEPQHGEECNINTIMRKMHAQGILPHFKTGGNFGNFTEMDDFHTCQNRIIAANNDFMALPSELRSKFQNDPGQLLDFLSDENNRAEAIEMGLIAPPGHLIEPPHTSAQDRAEGPSEAAQAPSSTKSKTGQKAENKSSEAPS